MIDDVEYSSLREEPLVSYVLGDEISFDISDIFNKYGFADGNLLSWFFYEYQRKNGIKESALCDDHIALYYVISRLVFEKHPSVELHFYTTCHNPVRTTTEEDEVYKHCSEKFKYIKIKDILSIFTELAFPNAARSNY